MKKKGSYPPKSMHCSKKYVRTGSFKGKCCSDLFAEHSILMNMLHMLDVFEVSLTYPGLQTNTVFKMTPARDPKQCGTGNKNYGTVTGELDIAALSAGKTLRIVWRISQKHTKTLHEHPRKIVAQNRLQSIFKILMWGNRWNEIPTGFPHDLVTRPCTK